MRRRMLMPVAVLLLFFGVLAALVAFPVAQAFIGITPMVAGPLPGDGMERVIDGYVSVGLIDAGEGQWALVDAGNDPQGTAILAALAAHGAGPGDVVGILLTHAHPDHVAACGLFPNAITYMMAEELPYATGKLPYRGPITHFAKASPVSCPRLSSVSDGANLKIGNRSVNGFLVPGHTAGSAAWLIGSVLFVGDSAGVKSKGLVGAPWVFSDDTAQNQASLVALGQRLADRPPLVVVPSHTGTIAGAALVGFGR